MAWPGLGVPGWPPAASFELEAFLGRWKGGSSLDPGHKKNILITSVQGQVLKCIHCIDCARLCSKPVSRRSHWLLLAHRGVLVSAQSSSHKSRNMSHIVTKFGMAIWRECCSIRCRNFVALLIVVSELEFTDLVWQHDWLRGKLG